MSENSPLARLSKQIGFPSDAGLWLRLTTWFYLSHLFFQWSVSASQVLLCLAIVSAIIAMARSELTPAIHELYLPLGTFLIGSTISALLAPNPVNSILEVGEWVWFLTFPVALTLYRRLPSLADVAGRTLLVMAVVISCHGLFQYIVLGHRDLEHRITGPAPHVMTFAGILLPTSLLALALWLESRRPWFGIAAFVTSGTLLLTMTRSAWLGWLCGFVAIIALKRARLLFYLLPAGLIVLILLPLPIFGRITSSFDLQRYSNLDRIRMIEAGAEIIRDNPVLGVGPGNIDGIYPLYRSSDAPRFAVPHLHNNLVQLWAERGIVPMAAYVAFLVLFARRCARSARRGDGNRALPLAGFSAAAALFVAGMFEFNFGDTEVLMTMLDVFAIASFGVAANDRAPVLVEHPERSPAPGGPAVTFHP